jgi:hypothetical protein
MVGLSASMSRFLIFLLTMFLTNVSMTSFVRFIGCVSKDVAAATPLAASTVILIVLYAGFMLTPANIPPYWIWMYYLSPLGWAMKALAVNEFLSPEYNIPTNPPSDQTLGEQYLEQFQYGTDKNIIITANLVNFGFLVSYTILSGFALNYMNVDSSDSGMGTSEEDLGLTITISRTASPPVTSPGKANVKHSSSADNLPLNVEERADMPFTPVTLSFKNLSYQVRLPKVKQPLVLLDSVTGYATPGTMTALMVPLVIISTLISSESGNPG